MMVVKDDYRVARGCACYTVGRTAGAWQILKQSPT